MSSNSVGTPGRRDNEQSHSPPSFAFFALSIAYVYAEPKQPFTSACWTKGLAFRLLSSILDAAMQSQEACKPRSRIIKSGF